MKFLVCWYKFAKEKSFWKQNKFMVEFFKNVHHNLTRIITNTTNYKVFTCTKNIYLLGWMSTRLKNDSGFFVNDF